MTSALIRFTTEDDGSIEISLASDPPLPKDPDTKMSTAQAFALYTFGFTQLYSIDDDFKKAYDQLAETAKARKVVTLANWEVSNG